MKNDYIMIFHDDIMISLMVILENDEYLHEIPAHLMGFHHSNKTQLKTSIFSRLMSAP